MTDFSSLNSFKKPIFFIPVILVILILTLATLNYLNILPLFKLVSPSQIPTQTPVKGKALHPEEPIIMPTESPAPTPTGVKSLQNVKLK